jgi:hypothetical protein
VSQEITMEIQEVNSGQYKENTLTVRARRSCLIHGFTRGNAVFFLPGDKEYSLPQISLISADSQSVILSEAKNLGIHHSLSVFFVSPFNLFPFPRPWTLDFVLRTLDFVRIARPV